MRDRLRCLPAGFEFVQNYFNFFAGNMMFLTSKGTEGLFLSAGISAKTLGERGSLEVQVALN